MELTGKHSNIMLVNTETNIIVDCIKRVPEHVSHVRQVLPNIPYSEQPMLKSNLFDIDFPKFMEEINKENKDQQIFKFLYTKYQGISPTIAREILVRANLFEDIYFSELDHDQMYTLWQTIDWLRKLVTHHKFQPKYHI